MGTIVIFFCLLKLNLCGIPYYFEDNCKCTVYTSRLSWLGSEGGRATGCAWKEQLCFFILVIQERWGVLFSYYPLYDFDFLTSIFEYWFYRILLQNCINNQMITDAGFEISIFLKISIVLVLHHWLHVRRLVFEKESIFVIWHLFNANSLQV